MAKFRDYLLNEVHSALYNARVHANFLEIAKYMADQDGIYHHEKWMMHYKAVAMHNLLKLRKFYH